MSSSELARAVSEFAQAASEGRAGDPFPPEEVPSPTEVAVTVCAMLEQAGIEVFELGLWRAWGTSEEAISEQRGAVR